MAAKQSQSRSHKLVKRYRKAPQKSWSCTGRYSCLGPPMQKAKALESDRQLLPWTTHERQQLVCLYCCWAALVLQVLQLHEWKRWLRCCQSLRKFLSCKLLQLFPWGSCKPLNIKHRSDQSCDLCCVSESELLTPLTCHLWMRAFSLP